MCGICGFTGAADRALLDGMVASIRHRGPDDLGTFADGAVNLGMSRLSIIDLSSGRQPQSNEDGTIHVVFNGEIYNYKELRRDLQAFGHTFKTESDTEVILHAYEEYGDDFPHRLNGMFAIALWAPKRSRLLLIRDRLGVKPLFYAHVNGRLTFGSEIKAILKDPGVPRHVDPEALSHYLCLRNIPAPLTIYRDVRNLPPGHLLEWTPSGIRTRAYWRLRYHPREWDEAELVARMDELLIDATRLRMRSDVPVGAYLSGGLDSSLCVALMGRFHHERIRTFSMGYEDQPSHKKDPYFARMVAEQYGTEHHELTMRWQELPERLIEVVHHLDQPFGGVLTSFFLTEKVRPFVKVVLSGDGADDQFASYGHHRLVWPIEEAKAGRVDGVPEMARKLAGLPAWEWRLRWGAFMEEEKRSLLSPESDRLLAPHSTPEFMRLVYESTPATVDPLNRMLALDVQTLLPNEVLYYSDLLSMAHGLEVRSPFLDYRVAELGATIPGTLKIRNGTLKYILKRVGEKYLPSEILTRPKEGFVLPANTWLAAGMKPYLEECLSATRLARHGLFDAKVVGDLVRRFSDGDESLTFRLWTLLMFQLWFEEVHGGGAVF